MDKNIEEEKRIYKRIDKRGDKRIGKRVDKGIDKRIVIKKQKKYKIHNFKWKV